MRGKEGGDNITVCVVLGASTQSLLALDGGTFTSLGLTHKFVIHSAPVPHPKKKHVLPHLPTPSSGCSRTPLSTISATSLRAGPCWCCLKWHRAALYSRSGWGHGRGTGGRGVRARVCRREGKSGNGGRKGAGRGHAGAAKGVGRGVRRATACGWITCVAPIPVSQLPWTEERKVLVDFVQGTFITPVIPTHHPAECVCRVIELLGGPCIVPLLEQQAARVGQGVGVIRGDAAQQLTAAWRQGRAGRGFRGFMVDAGCPALGATPLQCAQASEQTASCRRRLSSFTGVAHPPDARAPHAATVLLHKAHCAHTGEPSPARSPCSYAMATCSVSAALV